MPETTTVLVPFAHLAYGIARRDRSEKSHLVLEALPVVVPVLRPDATVSILKGGSRTDLPVHGRRLARPWFERVRGNTFEMRPVEDPDGEAWVSDWIDRVRKGNSPTRFSLAPVPLEDFGTYGTALRPDDMKTVAWTDRAERLSAFERGCRDLAMIGGRLCRFGDEPLIACGFENGTVSGENAHFASEVRDEIVRAVAPWTNGSSRGPYLRPDEYVRSGGSGRVAVEGPVEAVDWRTSSATATVYALLGDVFTTTTDEFSPQRTGELLRIAHQACAAALDYASERPSQTDPEALVDAAEGLLRSSSRGDAHRYAFLLERIERHRNLSASVFRREPFTNDDPENEALDGLRM